MGFWRAGQIREATHQFFITPRSLYLFITEARKESNLLDFDFWLNTIRILSNDAPVIVVLSKIDERDKDIPAFYKQRFQNIVEVVKTSCRRLRTYHSVFSSTHQTNRRSSAPSPIYVVEQMARCTPPFATRQTRLYQLSQVSRNMRQLWT